MPPRRLRARTGAPGRREFAQGGRQAAAELIEALAGAGAGTSSFTAVLDFGCGSGRVLPWMAAQLGARRCAGCDVDAEAVAWAGRHHPGLELVASRSEPPLPWPAGSFDLIYSISVFSHLDEPGQDRWLAELARLLGPGGRAVLTVHGAHAFDQFRHRRVRTAWCAPESFERGPLGTDEFLFVPYERSRWNRTDLPGVDPAYGLAFHGEAYVRERWGRWFQVDGVVPRRVTGWQDAVVLSSTA